ncbi:MAG TPA: M42 family metallopeptidase [Anaerolineae bacterium]|nr:M42 family metallopeptidase [Anaerolineae bacterium]
MDQTQKLLKEITEAAGVPGYEDAVRMVMRQHLEERVTIEQDKMGSFIGKHVGSSEEPRVMLVGHMDEIGFMVKLITKEGFVRFQPLGGWWDQVLLGHRVVIKTANGDVLGVLGAKPPHLLDADERKKLVEKNSMYIDVGARSEEEVREMGVRPGDPIIPVSEFSVMANPKFYLSKAFDNRVGCALAVQAVWQLAAGNHPNAVYAVGTVQEEVGLRGAKTSAHAIDPDVAIVLEVDIAGDVPGIKPEESAVKMGGGPTLLVYDARMIPNLKLRDLVIATAEELEIPLQFSAMPGGGTDGGMIHIHNEGVPSVVLGVPTRHIHSHNAILCRDDYDQALRLVVALVEKLDAETVAGLTA